MHPLQHHKPGQAVQPPSINTTLHDVAEAMDNISTLIRTLVPASGEFANNEIGHEAALDLRTRDTLPAEPPRPQRDWTNAARRTCVCGKRARVLPDEHGVMTCEACFEKIYLAELTTYAHSLRSLLVARASTARSTEASVAEGVMHVKALGLMAGMWRADSEIDRWLENILASTRDQTAELSTGSVATDDSRDEFESTIPDSEITDEQLDDLAEYPDADPHIARRPLTIPRTMYRRP